MEGGHKVNDADVAVGMTMLHGLWAELLCLGMDGGLVYIYILLAGHPDTSTH